MAKNEYTMLSAIGTSYQTVDKTEVDKNGLDFIMYGTDNLYPQNTIDLYQNSATHNALVNSISSWIYGAGIDASNKEQFPEEFANFTSLITKSIGKNDIQLMCMDLKLHGGFYISFTYTIDRESLAEVNVIPFETMRSGKENEDGEIEWYYYSRNWGAGNRAEKKQIKSYSPSEKNIYPTQVLFVKMNTVGSYYYPKPDYIGAWNYIELDKNVSQFHLSQIENGLAPSYIFNFKNGVPPREKREEIKRNLEAELSGSQNAGKFLCTFSNGGDTAPDITPIELTDAHNQYQFLSEEITKKVMISHRVVSPRLFGVMDGGGLGNNADELIVASQLFEKTVVNPFRALILDALNIIAVESGANLRLIFKDFSLFETSTISEEDIVEEGFPERLSSKLTDETGDELITKLKEYGAVNDSEEWELQSEEWVDTTNENFHEICLNKMPSNSMDDADSKSKWGDTGLYKVRYFYKHTAGKEAHDESRPFCKAMMLLSNAGTEWRYEDIKAMSKDGVNGDLSERGHSTYDLFLYKGGVNCYHGWMRRIYFRKRDDKGRVMPNDGMKNEIRVGNNPYVKQKGKEYIAPINTKNQGRVN